MGGFTMEKFDLMGFLAEEGEHIIKIPERAIKMRNWMERGILN